MERVSIWSALLGKFLHWPQTIHFPFIAYPNNIHTNHHSSPQNQSTWNRQEGQNTVDASSGAFSWCSWSSLEALVSYEKLLLLVPICGSIAESRHLCIIVNILCSRMAVKLFLMNNLADLIFAWVFLQALIALICISSYSWIDLSIVGLYFRYLWSIWPVSRFTICRKTQPVITYTEKISW